MAVPDNVMETAKDTPSLPLYAAGFVITLCGILAASAALTSPDYTWLTSTLMLSGLGFLFSYGMRRLGIAAGLLDYGFAGLALLLLAGVATHQVSLVQLLPLGADQPNLRLLATLVWSGTLWSWALRNDNRVAFTTVPTMAALGMAAEIDVNTPVLVCFGVFILTVIFLLIHQNFLQNKGRAAGPDRRPSKRLLLAQLVQAGLCGVAVLLAGMLVIVPAQVVFSHLSLAQAIRHLAAIRTDPANPNSVQSFSDEDNLSIGTGDAWSASADVVMRVTPSDGQPHYWRGRTYDLYTGNGWQSSLEDSHKSIGADAAPDDAGAGSLFYTLPLPLTPGDPADLSSRVPLTAAFEVRGRTAQFYYADTPRQIQFNAHASGDTSGTLAWQDGRLGLADGGAVRFPYRITFLPPPDVSQTGVAGRLRSAGTTYPKAVADLYLKQSNDATPDDLAFYRQCVADAFQALSPGQHDPLDEAQALRLWVSRRCVYTLAPPPLPDGADRVHAFLGDTRKGYCDMFASSLAILCRTAGIPSRLAVGFAPGDPDGASFNLRAEDKHAWTEVYFPGTGWVEFDATAGTTTDGTVPNAPGPKTSWLSRLRLPLGSDMILIYPLVGIILAIAAYVAKTELLDPWRLRRAAQAAPRAARPVPNTQTAEPYRRLCAALARLGLPHRPSETPAEYAARVLPELPPLEREWSVALPPALVLSLTVAFTEALYADPSGPPPPVQPWNTRVAEFEAAARRIVRGRFWQRVLRQKPRMEKAQD